MDLSLVYLLLETQRLSDLENPRGILSRWVTDQKPERVSIDETRGVWWYDAEVEEGECCPEPRVEYKIGETKQRYCAKWKPHPINGVAGVFDLANMNHLSNMTHMVVLLNRKWKQEQD